MAAKRSEAPRGPSELRLSVTYDAPAVAREQAWAEGELPGLATFSVPDQDTYAATDAFLTEVVTKRDAIEAMRAQATKPLQESLSVIRSWFAPALVTLAAIETRLKGAMADFRLAELAREKEARARALAAVQTNDAPALVEALTVASQAQSAGSAGRATARFMWKVKRIVPDLLASQYWVPDMAAIEAEAKRQGVSGDEPPVVPGVVFERVARIGARR